MKITLDLNEKEIRALEVSLLEAKSSIHKMYVWVIEDSEPWPDRRRKNGDYVGWREKYRKSKPEP